jgi:ribosomal protein S20
LCVLALKRYQISTTRQTIQKTRIKTVYKERKKALRSGQDKPKTPASLNIAAKRIDKLENENSRLKSEEGDLLAQFVVWQYNAYANGMTMEQLNRAMPEKNTG